MPSADGYFTIYHDCIYCTENSVNNRIRDRAVIVLVSIDSIVPTFSMVLRTENHRTVYARFNDFQQVIAFIRSQTANQPLIKNQQINLLVRLNDFSKFAVHLGNTQLIQKFRYLDISYCFEPAESGVTECTDDLCLTV